LTTSFQGPVGDARLRQSEQSARDARASLASIQGLVLTVAGATEVEEILSALAVTVQSLLPGSVIITSRVTGDGTRLQPVGLAADEEVLSGLHDRLGFSLLDTSFPLEEPPPAERGVVREGRLYRQGHGLFAVTRGALPRESCRVIESAFGVAEVWSTRLALDDRELGAMSLLLPPAHGLPRMREAIEILVDVSRIAIQRTLYVADLRERGKELACLHSVSELDD